jgi:hypothetical protein
MSSVEPESATNPLSSPHAEQLRVAMGWDKLPEMTPEQRARFDEENRRVSEEARRFYSGGTVPATFRLDRDVELLLHRLAAARRVQVNRIVNELIESEVDREFPGEMARLRSTEDQDGHR